jgi:hypothetical protein
MVSVFVVVVVAFGFWYWRLRRDWREYQDQREYVAWMIEEKKREKRNQQVLDAYHRAHASNESRIGR